MTGREFEIFIGTLFEKMGYIVEITQCSGDQGIDILIEKNNQKIGVQVKCYSNKVTNKAIQEVTAGLNYYNCDKGMVITNNYYTNSAIELSEANNIVLWDRDMLKQLLDEFNN
ncbi:restriction endonuclease [Clostridium botulinum]|nr:restriction endonuclease [Clostridium botulinum]